METDTPPVEVPADAVEAPVEAQIETDTPPVQVQDDAPAVPVVTPSPGTNEQRRKQKPKQSRFPKGFNIKAYRSLKRGLERKNYLIRFSQRYGYQLPKPVIPSANPAFYKKKKVNAWCRLKGPDRKEYYSKKTKEERQEFLRNYRETPRDEEPPPPKPAVPQNFAWPKGMDRKEFLAKKPGVERMAYLAWHIRNNGVELEERPASVHVPIGRQPAPRAYPRCGCSSSESCASCSRCVELHCVCGLTGRQRRAVCHESRACSCSLTDPTTRCKLCHGCRQPHGFFSHCRCVLHQQLLWTKRHPELEVKLAEEEEETLCSCFLLENRHGGDAAAKEKEAIARQEMERVRRIRRAAGFPSCDNIYRSNKIATVFDDEGLVSDFDDGVDDGPGSEVLPPSTESVIPRTMVRRMVHSTTFPASYHPLHRSEGCSLLETIEPRGGRISRRTSAAIKSDAIQSEIVRGLENISYEIDRDAAMPPDDLLDFLVYMASVKAANVGELIGTFEDSAAVAASIVMEEYMAQIVEDTVVQQQALCPPTEASVQGFSRDLLVGFNWQLFDRQHPFSPSDPKNRVLSLVEKESMLRDTLSDLILREFVSTQSTSFDVMTHGKELFGWIRSVIVIPPFILTGRTGAPPRIGMPKRTKDQTPSSPSKEHPSKKRRLKKKQQSNKQENQPSNKVGTAPSTPQIRLAVKANPKYGNPTYKVHFATTLEDELHVETSVGGLDSKMKAMATVSHLAKVVEHHERKSKGALVAPPKFPGPSPTISPVPPEDPNDPYHALFTSLCGNVNGYKKRRWEALMDRYLSATMPGWKAPEQEAGEKRSYN
ncbi:hypothetical protein V7S43_006882 [Phytophthora oleae]|uniref:Uncharacterized protein n=1 Tax=Phytophthora oleae TaxID=2107226 RepID=A0ABD3FM72_9STRA